MHVLIEFLTIRRSYTKKNLVKLLLKFVAHIFTLLLAPFWSKLVNHSRHSESLNFNKNWKSTTLSFEYSESSMSKDSSKTQTALKN